MNCTAKKRLIIPFLGLLIITPLFSLESSVSLNGQFRNYTQHGSYDSSIEKTHETDYNYEIKGFFLSRLGIGLYASAALMTPQDQTITYQNGSTAENNLSADYSLATGFSYMIGAAGMIHPTFFMDLYLGLGYCGTRVTWKQVDVNENVTYAYQADLNGWGADLGLKFNLQDPLFVNLGCTMLLQTSATEEVTSSDTTETATTGLSSLDVRPYIGIGLSF